MFLLVGVALAVRFGHMALMADSPLFLSPTSDAFEHYDLARKLAAGDWLGRSVGPYFRPQLFAYFCGALYAVFGISFVLLHVVLGVIDSVAVLGWYALGRRCFPRPAATVGALAIALHWPFVYFAASGYMETFAMALMSVFLLMLAEHARRVCLRGRGGSPWIPLVAAGIVGGLCALTRPTTLICMPGIGIALAALHLGKERRPLAIARACLPTVVLALCMVVTMSPNAIRHAAMFGLWAPMGTASEMGIHMGNNFDGWGWEVSSPGLEFEVYQKLPLIEGGAEPTISGFRTFWRARNAERIGENPTGFIGGIALKVLQLLNAKEVHCTQDFLYAREKSVLLRLLPGLGLFAPFAIVGALAAAWLLSSRARWNTWGANRAQRWSILLLLLWVVPYLAGVAVYLAISRHRLPMIPCALLLGGWAAWMLWRAFHRPRVAIWPWLAALVAGLALSRLPVLPLQYLDRHERWWTQVNLGSALQSLNRPAEAVVELEKSVEVMPDKLEGWRQLARALGSSGRPADAARAQKELLVRVRTQYPEYYMVEAAVLEQLARYQIEASDPAGAVLSARRIVAMVPDATAGRLLLAFFLRADGKEGEAREEFARVLELDPGNATAQAALAKEASP